MAALRLVQFWIYELQIVLGCRALVMSYHFTFFVSVQIKLNLSEVSPPDGNVHPRMLCKIEPNLRVDPSFF